MKDCLNCKIRYTACQDYCPIHKINVEKKHQAAERERQAKSSVGWDGYHKSMKDYRMV